MDFHRVAGEGRLLDEKPGREFNEPNPVVARGG